MLKANEVKITITVVNRSFNKITFGPLLVGEVVKTINIPITQKAMDAQTKTFVAIFCIVLVYQLKHFPQIIWYLFFLTMHAASPTARPALSFYKFRARSLDMDSSSL